MMPAFELLVVFAAGYGARWLHEHLFLFRRRDRAKPDITPALARERKRP